MGAKCRIWSKMVTCLEKVLNFISLNPYYLQFSHSLVYINNFKLPFNLIDG